MASTIIHLNGASSSGKTSLALALQERLLPDIYLNFSIDSILYALPPSALKRMTTGQDISDLNFDNLVVSYYKSAAALAAQGNNLIMDDAVTDEQGVSLVREHLGPFRPVVVGVRCEVEELKRRELARGDRTLGEAEWHASLVHKFLKHHFEVDTTRKTPAQAADEIVEFLNRK